MKQALCLRPASSPRPRPARATLLVTFAVAGLAAAALAQEDATPAPDKPAAAAAAPPVKVDPAALSRGNASGITSFAPIVDKVAPSVVTVYTSKTVKRDLRTNPRGNGNQDNDLLRRFFGGQLGPDGGSGRAEPMQALGSGVVISPDGQILTNNHVIDGADEILVRFGSNDKEYKATKVGADPSTDLAVLKINAKDLPAVTFADSDKAHIGDLVLAIGNPFGLGQTVTMGIISATGRGGIGILNQDGYENFIQTDASINPGNSGGALVDAEGRVVGINTAIYSRSGGNQGIGFAVPSNLARHVFQSLHQNGRVVRGYLGTLIQPLTGDLAKAMKLPEDSAGALISQVESGSPAEKAGIKEGDVVTGLDGKKVPDARQLRLAVSEMPPGSKVTLKVLRDGKDKDVAVTLGELTASKSRASRGNNGGVDGDNDEQSIGGKSNVLDGITVGNIDDKARADLKLPAKLQGALITAVDPDCAGYQAGLRQGDVVLEVNREPVKDADEAVTLSDKVEKDESALLRVYSKGGSRYVALAPKAP